MNVWIERGRTYERARQFGLRCARCGRWAWARMMVGGSIWWCHRQPDGFVHEGTDCPNCGESADPMELKTYERRGRS